ncbi:MAG TPA: DNA mismatch endonuclease Vsr [bacterium]|nr:DNA mismatch endonuclease Vsr [bacterium]
MQKPVVDNLSPARRSWNMARIKSEFTLPERAVAEVLDRMGVHYTTHDRSLPGTPDLVMRQRRKVVFVHGCFWHGHRCKRGRHVPKSNVSYWREKIRRNRVRQRAALGSLRELGYVVSVVWECQSQDKESLTSKLRSFLQLPQRAGIGARKEARPSHRPLSGD